MFGPSPLLPSPPEDKYCVLTLPLPESIEVIMVVVDPVALFFINLFHKIIIQLWPRQSPVADRSGRISILGPSFYTKVTIPVLEPVLLCQMFRDDVVLCVTRLRTSIFYHQTLEPKCGPWGVAAIPHGCDFRRGPFSFFLSMFGTVSFPCRAVLYASVAIGTKAGSGASPCS